MVGPFPWGKSDRVIRYHVMPVLRGDVGNRELSRGRADQAVGGRSPVRGWAEQAGDSEKGRDRVRKGTEARPVPGGIARRSGRPRGEERDEKEEQGHGVPTRSSSFCIFLRTTRSKKCMFAQYEYMHTEQYFTLQRAIHSDVFYSVLFCF